jgi:hypothetical protein
MTVSRTIMDWVLEQKQGVLISDASRVGSMRGESLRQRT